MSASELLQTSKERDQAVIEREELRAELVECRAVLREVEWMRLGPVQRELIDEMMFCPVCRRFTKNAVEFGHAPDCRLAKCLG